MQSVAIVKVSNFLAHMRYEDIHEVTDRIYEIRNIAMSRLQPMYMSTFQDMIIMIFPSVQEAADKVKDLIHTIYTMSNTRLSACIGYGYFFRTRDNTYWGEEITNAFDTVQNARAREILFTDYAKMHITSFDVCEL